MASGFGLNRNPPNIVEIADALGDLLYVVLGAGVAYGIDLEPVFKEIHRSNMTKIWEDGTVHYREDGKVIKPPTYSKARVDMVILGQITGNPVVTTWGTDQSVEKASSMTKEEMLKLINSKAAPIRREGEIIPEGLSATNGRRYHFREGDVIYLLVFDAGGKLSELYRKEKGKNGNEYVVVK